MYQYYKKERDSLHFNTFKEKERLALPSKFLYVELDQKKITAIHAYLSKCTTGLYISWHMKHYGGPCHTLNTCLFYIN